MAHLYVHQNPHAPVRANGKRFWGYPRRREPMRVIALHTAENLPDFSPPDHGAESVARYLAGTSRPASYHEVVDSDTFITLLPPEAVAFGIGNFNSMTWHLSFATEAHKWGTKPGWWEESTLRLGAARAAKAVESFGIPLTLLTAEQARQAGTKGFTFHSRMDPSRRSDPGQNFPHDRFFGYVNEALRPPTYDYKVAVVADTDVDEGIAQVLGRAYLWKVLRVGHSETVEHAILIGKAQTYAGRYPKHSVIAGATRRETAQKVWDKIRESRREP